MSAPHSAMGTLEPGLLTPFHEKGLVYAKYDYIATDQHELSMQRNERLRLLNDSQHWWCVMNSNGFIGYVPSNYCKRVKQGLFSSLRSTLRRKGRSKSSSSQSPSAAFRDRGYHHSVISPSPPDPLLVGDNCHRNSQTVVVHHHNNNSPGTYHLPLPPSASLNDNSQQQQQQLSPFSNSSLGFYPTFPPVTNAMLLRPPVVVVSSSPTGMAAGACLMQGMETTRSPAGMPSSLAYAPVNKYNYDNPASTSARYYNLPFAGLEEAGSLGRALDGATNENMEEYCCAKFPYKATQIDELSIEKGDRIRVFEKSPDGWWRGTIVGRTGDLSFDNQKPQRNISSSIGWFPSNYVILEKRFHMQQQQQQSFSTVNSNNNNIGNGNGGVAGSRNIPSLAQQQHQQQPPPPPLPISTGINSSSNALLSSSMGGTRLSTTGSPARVYSSIGFNPVHLPMPTTTSSPSPQNYIQFVSCKSSSSTATTPTSIQDDPIQRIISTLTPPLHKDLLVKSWYWGAVGRADAEFLLRRGAQPGADVSGRFLVRDCESEPGNLALTMCAREKIRNFRVQRIKFIVNDNDSSASRAAAIIMQQQQHHQLHHHSRFQIGHKVFNSLEELISYYHQRPIYIHDQHKFYLTEALIKTPLQHQQLAALAV